MIRRLSMIVTATCLLTAGMAGAQGPSDSPFGEGWRRVVPVPMTEPGEGDRYVAWVEGGWLQVRRETSKGLTDWHVVLARVAGMEPPVIEAKEGTTRFALSLRGGRYFVREDLDLLTCLREPKRSEDGAWPAVKLSTDRYIQGGSVSDGGHPPMLQCWRTEEDLFIAMAMGPAEERRDCLVRLTTKRLKVPWGARRWGSHASNQRFYHCGKDWLYDDGELLVARRTLEATLELEVDDPAPPLAAKSLDGKAVNLEDYRGKFVLLDFWATWCGPCLEEIPNLKEVHETFGKDGRLVMIGVSLDEGADAPRKLVKARGIPWLQVHAEGATGGPVARAYRAQAIPAIFLVGPDGKVVAKGLRGEQIKEVVAKALGKN